MSFFSWCQIVRFIMLVPNCPGANLSGAKLSVFVMLVPNCPGAKLSGAKLSGAKLSHHPPSSIKAYTNKLSTQMRFLKLSSS